MNDGKTHRDTRHYDEEATVMASKYKGRHAAGGVATKKAQHQAAEPVEDIAEDERLEADTNDRHTASDVKEGAEQLNDR